MIAPGTLCLIVAPHTLAGRCCTVIRPTPVGTRTCSSQTAVSLIVTEAHEFYEIAVDVPCPKTAWIAYRRCLIPLTPPGITTDERNQEPVAA